MDNVTLQIKFGKDLTERELEIINLSRKQEFHAKTEHVLDSRSAKWLWFLVYDTSRQLRSFGRLHEVTVQFHRIIYPILGISTIISLEKGKGYGSMIMTKMKVHIEGKSITAIGFCDPKNSKFYEKCGYSILKKGVDRFIYLDDDDNPVPGLPGDMIYLEGKDKLVEKIIASPKEKITSFKLQW